MTGTWVRHRSQAAKHRCTPPERRLPTDYQGPIFVADGSWRDLWRCDCGKLWRHTVFGFWRSAWPWQSRRLDRVNREHAEGSETLRRARPTTPWKVHEL